MTTTHKTVRVFISSTFPPSPLLHAVSAGTARLAPTWISLRRIKRRAGERMEQVGLEFFDVDLRFIKKTTAPFEAKGE